jgi:hypothetical protein
MIDLTRFLTYLLLAQNADSDAEGAGRAALLTSMLDVDLPTGAVLVSAIAGGLASPPSPTTTPAGGKGLAGLRGRGRGRRGHAKRAARAKVKVPSVRHLSDPEQIHAHLHQHKLRSLVHREAMADIKTPRVVRQWPDADADVDEGAEINVLLLVPEDGRRDEAETRPPTRK